MHNCFTKSTDTLCEFYQKQTFSLLTTFLHVLHAFKLKVLFSLMNHLGSLKLNLNSMKLVIPLHSLYWSIHTEDESKRGIEFAFIFGVNWLWRSGVTASFGVFFHEMKCNGMTIFMEFVHRYTRLLQNATGTSDRYKPLSDLSCKSLALCCLFLITNPE